MLSRGQRSSSRLVLATSYLTHPSALCCSGFFGHLRGSHNMYNQCRDSVCVRWVCVIVGRILRSYPESLSRKNYYSTLAELPVDDMHRMPHGGHHEARPASRGLSEVLLRRSMFILVGTSQTVTIANQGCFGSV